MLFSASLNDERITVSSSSNVPMIARRLNRRISDVTRLDMKTAESLQVNDHAATARHGARVRLATITTSGQNIYTNRPRRIPLARPTSLTVPNGISIVPHLFIHSNATNYPFFKMGRPYPPSFQIFFRTSILHTLLCTHATHRPQCELTAYRGR